MPSADTHPISPARFAAALKDLSPAMLHAKMLEIRNSLAHLEYSNDQLKPYADGTATVDAELAGGSVASNLPKDQDCAEAIRENEVVIDRMAERLAIVRVEVESRGLSWSDFWGRDGETEVNPELIRAGVDDAAGAGRHAAWSDGTFQTGSTLSLDPSIEDFIDSSFYITKSPSSPTSLADMQMMTILLEQEQKVRARIMQQKGSLGSGGGSGGRGRHDGAHL